jgi:signal transduction histidine kinase
LLHTLLAILAAAGCYYLATRIAWTLTFPDSKVSLFFPPHAVLVWILLLVPRRQWWAYALAAVSAHFIATRQADWPMAYALQCEAFDAAKALLTAAGIRMFTQHPFHRFSVRDAIAFVLVGVVVVPFAAAFWGAAFTLSYNYGADYWIEWRNLGISNGVTVIVLAPAILLGTHALHAANLHPRPARVLEAGALAAAILAVCYLTFNSDPAGPDTSPALLYAPIPLLIWAVLRFGLGGMSAAMVAITMLAIWGTMQGRGPFLTQAPAENALDLQMFLLMVATPLVLLAVAISDERRSKDALRVSDERMNLAVESAQLMLWDWDASNDQVWMSEPGRKFFGFGPTEELRLSDLLDRVHPEDHDLRAAAIKEAHESGGTYEVEYRVVLPDKSVRWIAARGRSQPPASGGEAPRVLGVPMDVTRQKQSRAEAQQHREELAHLSRAATLSTLSGSLAHELSQPLSSMLSNAQAGLRFLAQEPPAVDEIKEILASIVSEDRRAGQIIDRLRMMLKRGEVDRQLVVVNDALEELLRIARHDLMARRIRVEVDAAERLPRVMTDRVQLQQVLLNLIVNAGDAMAGVAPEHRLLTITTSIVEDELRIAVLDRGTGVPEDVEGLFQPFHTTKEHGLGMGLSICRTLMDAHHGRLWGERRDGGGAAFTVALPLPAQEESNP